MTPLDIHLTDLIASIDVEVGGAAALARVSEAQLRSQTLADLGEQLVDHYVSQAKRGGASWTAIGEALGVTKQAAQQRRTGAPFDRFTRLARHSIVLAQEAARTRRHELIGTEHLLLGVLGESEGVAHRILTADGRTERSVREAIDAAAAPAGPKALRGHIAFAPASRQALDQSRWAAEEFGHDYVGTEHLLLGLARTESGVAAGILTELGLTEKAVADAVRTVPTSPRA